MTIAYGGAWFALALVFSIVFRAPATAVLAAGCELERLRIISRLRRGCHGALRQVGLMVRIQEGGPGIADVEDDNLGRLTGAAVMALVYGVKSGIGLGPLPTAIADDQEDLVRVLGPIPELARSWRLLTHPGLRRTPRVSGFFDFVAEERAALKAIFTG